MTWGFCTHMCTSVLRVALFCRLTYQTQGHVPPLKQNTFSYHCDCNPMRNKAQTSVLWTKQGIDHQNSQLRSLNCASNNGRSPCFASAEWLPATLHGSLLQLDSLLTLECELSGLEENETNCTVWWLQMEQPKDTETEDCTQNVYECCIFRFIYLSALMQKCPHGFVKICLSFFQPVCQSADISSERREKKVLHAQYSPFLNLYVKFDLTPERHWLQTIKEQLLFRGSIFERT